jgi:hypothetical protein
MKMTREEWKNYREFDRLCLEMNGGITGWRNLQAATDTVPGESASAVGKDDPIAQG